jgi:hypothetical protein
MDGVNWGIQDSYLWAAAHFPMFQCALTRSQINVDTQVHEHYGPIFLTIQLGSTGVLGPSLCHQTFPSPPTMIAKLQRGKRSGHP